MNDQSVLSEFQARVDEWVADTLAGYEPEKHDRDKSIRDAVWGTSRFHPWEVAILDSPLLQRLRDIRQTGLSQLVYPTALHTRLDHTLGVVTVAGRIVSSINEKQEGKIDRTQHMLVRLSALLHDVGHSCLSHVSETIYGQSDGFRALIGSLNETYQVTPKPHEVMSWLVVRSKPFREFMQRLQAGGILKGWVCTDDHLDEIAGNIIGYRAAPSEKFLADIVNGPMDAYKLDYLVRDAYFAGPTVVYDLERFLYTVDAIEYPRLKEGEKIVRLSIPIEGITALEQIIISKLMLYSYLYHHHKIRCVEGMFHQALKRLTTLPKKDPVLGHPVDFLRLTDRSLLSESRTPGLGSDDIANEMLQMLANRELYTRALIISRLFIPDFDGNQTANLGFGKLLACGRNAAEKEHLQKQIYNGARRKMQSGGAPKVQERFKPHHVLLDIPKPPTVEEVRSVMIPISARPGRAQQEFVPLTDIFPIEKWVDAYNAIKWRGHVFALREAVPFVNAAALEILRKDPYHLEFNAQATELCKIAYPNEANGTLFPAD